jgi:hypothetical protein
MTSRWTVSAVALVMAFTATTALAQDAQQKTAAVCTSGGVTYAAGEYACIPACHGQRRLARCDVTVPSSAQGSAAQSTQSATWTYVSDACPSAMIINPPWPSDWSETPLATDMTPLPVKVIMSAISPAIAPKVGSHWTALIR